MQIPISDHWSQNLAAFFPQAIEFIGEYLLVDLIFIKTWLFSQMEIPCIEVLLSKIRQELRRKKVCEGEGSENKYIFSFSREVPFLLCV